MREAAKPWHAGAPNIMCILVHAGVCEHLSSSDIKALRLASPEAARLTRSSFRVARLPVPVASNLSKTLSKALKQQPGARPREHRSRERLLPCATLARCHALALRDPVAVEVLDVALLNDDDMREDRAMPSPADLWRMRRDVWDYFDVLRGSLCLVDWTMKRSTPSFRGCVVPACLVDDVVTGLSRAAASVDALCVTGVLRRTWTHELLRALGKLQVRPRALCVS